MLVLDGYIRVSRIGGRKGDGYIAPDVQRERIEGYAAELGATIGAWHDDQDYSGGNLERPGFQAALDRIRSHETGGIVVASIDRFARSTADGASIVREIVNDHGAVFAACQERIDPKTPEGHFMLVSFLNNAELFLNRMKASWAISKDKAIKRGAHIGRTPFGYTRAAKGTEHAGTLTPHETHAKAVLAAFEARRERASYSAIARRLDEIAPKPTAWTVVDVKRMLQNRVYLGEVRYGEQVNRAAHPPIVSTGLFAAVQLTIDEGRQRKAETPFLLSGLVRCAHCRYAMGGFSRGGAKRDTPVYRCISRGNRCDARPLITAATLETFVIDAWRQAMRDEAGRESQPAPPTVDIAALEDERTAAAGEVDEWIADATLRKRLGRDRWQAGLDARLSALEDIERSIASAHAESATREGVRFDPDTTDRGELRAALPEAIRYVFVRAGRMPVAQRALIVPRSGPDFETPGRGVAGPFPALPWTEDVPVVPSPRA